MKDEEIEKLVRHLRADIYTLGAILTLTIAMGVFLVAWSANHIATILCQQHPVEVCKRR